MHDHIASQRLVKAVLKDESRNITTAKECLKLVKELATFKTEERRRVS